MLWHFVKLAGAPLMCISDLVLRTLNYFLSFVAFDMRMGIFHNK